VSLVAATRDAKAGGLPQLRSLVENGASVRASVSAIRLAKANAFLAGRTYVSPHDVKSLAHDVLRHRLLLTYEAEAQSKTADDVVGTILENVEVP
jgi:MoxR-like ATPase